MIIIPETLRQMVTDPNAKVVALMIGSAAAYLIGVFVIGRRDLDKPAKWYDLRQARRRC